MHVDKLKLKQLVACMNKLNATLAKRAIAENYLSTEIEKCLLIKRAFPINKSTTIFDLYTKNHPDESILAYIIEIIINDKLIYSFFSELPIPKDDDFRRWNKKVGIDLYKEIARTGKVDTFIQDVGQFIGSLAN